MAVPYNTTVTGTNVRDALGRHLRIKHNNAWQYVEDVNYQDNGTWRDIKEVHVKHDGAWRLVHEGEHFLFNIDLPTSSSGDYDLAAAISGLGYSGNKVKGLLTVGSKTDAGVQEIARNRVNMGNFSSDSKIYLRINLNCRITGTGGNGGLGGQFGSNNNGGNGGRALYTRTPFILDNAGTIAGGGGGGGSGNNSNCVYQNTAYFSYMKAQQCSEPVQNQSPAYGGGGGGGAGFPGGANGGSGSNNGQQWNAGGGGGNGGCGSNSGGAGGSLGNNGQSAPGGGGSGGSGGTGIDGWSYRINTPTDYWKSFGNGEGDIRGGKIN